MNHVFEKTFNELSLDVINAHKSFEFLNIRSFFQIEIIGLNRKTYETRRRVVHLHIENKSEIATHQIYLKVDNLNVDDFFDLYRMSKLLNIFKYKLWKESFFDLYFTFLSSAVSLGARRPLRPTEGEGY